MIASVEEIRATLSRPFHNEFHVDTLLLLWVLITRCDDLQFTLGEIQQLDKIEFDRLRELLNATAAYVPRGT